MNQLLPLLVLDTNVFIQAYRQCYPFDICPGYWDFLIYHQQQNSIKSVDKVWAEINRVKDPLQHWVRQKMPKDFFAPTNTSAVMQHYQNMNVWVQYNCQFTPAAKAEFRDTNNADGFVLAFAKAKEGVIITEEKHNSAITKKVPIPNVGAAFGVRCESMQWMLRTLKARFDFN